MAGLKLVVISDPTARHLKLLDKLPKETEIVVGLDPAHLAAHIADADVVLNGMSVGAILQELWPLARKLQWVHSLSAGVEGVLFPALVASPIPLTNARGVFKRSLGEWTLAAILYYAKDLRRLIRNQEQARWEQFDVEELHHRVLGVIGYGEIGKAAAQRAHAFGMRVHALRRRPVLSSDDPLVEQWYGMDQRGELLAGADYVVVATPLTPQTRGLIGEGELRAMKPSAVIINVGRGPVIDEAALVKALREGWIRGAALDVFDTEPLPADHPFWSLPNVLLSPHSADHTSDWLEQAMDFFVSNFYRFRDNERLENMVDKHAGY